MITEKIKKDFLKWQKGRSGSVTTLAFLDTEGVLHYCGNTACHAGMRYANDYIEGNKQISALISGVQDVGSDYIFSDEHKLKFFDYMINRSPYKGCFLNKDAQEVLESFWLLNPESPCNLLTSAAFATRHLTEWPANFNAWLALVDAGVSEDKAFFFSYYLSGRDTFHVTDRGGWHQPFHFSRNSEYFSNWVNHTPRKDYVGESYQKMRRYTNVSNVWGKCERQFVESRVLKAIKPIEANQIDLTKKNIFYKPTLAKAAQYEFKTRDQLLSFVTQAEKLYEAA
jgi:hypothetical protein